MQALTICQPYPFLILLPASDERRKRVENRTWPTKYRGPLAIHAGKSTQWLDTDGSLLPEESEKLVFGAVVGICNLVECLHIDTARKLPDENVYGWVKYHPHAEGPFCWILDYAHPLPAPVAATGKQGLWDWPCPEEYLK